MATSSTCYLCLQSATRTQPQVIPCFGWTSVAEVLDKHFCFKLDRERDAEAVVCKPCWLKVDAFHAFHESVMASHRRRLLNSSAAATPASIRPIKCERELSVDDPLEASSDEIDPDGLATQKLEIEMDPGPATAHSNGDDESDDCDDSLDSDYLIQPDAGSDKAEKQPKTRRVRKATAIGYQRILKTDREMLWKLFNDGNSVTQAARIAGINVNTAKSIIKRIGEADGVVGESRRGGKRTSGKVNRVLDTLEMLIESQPNIALKVAQAKVKELLNEDLSLTAVHGAMKRLRITVKRRPVEAAELNAAATVEQRVRYAVRYLQNAPAAQENVIFIDISTFKYHERQSKLRPSEDAAVSLIIAMNVHGIVLYNTMSQTVVDAGCLSAYLGQLMAKLQQMGIANAWLVMDSTQIHPQPAVCWQSLRDLVAAGSHSLIFLPPHSPTLNPLELIVGKIKSHSRDMLEPMGGNVAAIIPRTVEMISAAECRESVVDMTSQVSQYGAMKLGNCN